MQKLFVGIPIEIIENCELSALNSCAKKQLALLNHLNLYDVIT